MATTKTKGSRTDAVTVAPDDFLRIEKFLNTHVLIEREQELRVLLRVLIAGVNGHLIGGGGVAKSLALRELARCITGAKYFGKSLQPGTPPEAVIGPYDYAAMAQGGHMERKFDGFLPDANIGFIDELLRSSGLMKDSLMPLLNAEEREAEANGGMVKTDLLAMFTASNTWFEPNDPYTAAIEDRITVILEVDDLRADESFKELLVRDHARKQALVAGTYEQSRETVTLDQLRLAQAQAQAIEPAAAWRDAAAELRSQANAAGLSVSPRRWIELSRLCRANAWFSGRDHLIPEDLVVVENGLWREKDQKPTARKLVQAFRGRFEQLAEERRAEAEDAFSQIEQIRAKVEATPLDEDHDQETMLAVIKATRKIAAVRKRVNENIDEAKKEQRSPDDLIALQTQLDSVRDWAAKHGLPTHD